MAVQGFGFRGLGFRVYGVQGFGFRGLGFRVYGVEGKASVPVQGFVSHTRTRQVGFRKSPPKGFEALACRALGLHWGLRLSGSSAWGLGPTEV